MPVDFYLFFVSFFDHSQDLTFQQLAGGQPAGGEFAPTTPEGRGLAFLITLFGFAIFGYVTATLATFFIGWVLNRAARVGQGDVQNIAVQNFNKATPMTTAARISMKALKYLVTISARSCMIFKVKIASQPAYFSNAFDENLLI